MFDMLKDVYAEMNGLDTEEIAKERVAKRAEKKKSRFIFSKAGKGIVLAVGIMYIVVAATNIAIAVRTGTLGIADVKYFAFSVVAIGIIVALFMKKKQAEVAALVGIIIFVIGNYMVTLIQY